MNKPRIIILTPIPFWHPGTEEYISLLKKHGYIVVAIDIWDFHYYDENGTTHFLYPKLLNGFWARVYKKVNRRKIIKKYIFKDDIVDIQWCGHYYAKYIDDLVNINKSIIVSPFGSDVLRASEVERKIQKKIFDTAKLIVLGENWKEVFLSYFPGNESKLRYCQFGSARFDGIVEQYSDSYKLQLRKKYEVPVDKVCVTFGYSSNPVQQHLVFFDSITKYKSRISSKVFFLFPLTYGIEKDSEYYKTLIERIKTSGFEYLIFENRLTNDELCETRIISDMMVNIQTTDSQASSIKEAFAARNVVLVGDWLPYQFYLDAGVKILKTDLISLPETFVNVVENFKQYKEGVNDNYLRVEQYASWNKIISCFINNYIEVQNGRDK